MLKVIKNTPLENLKMILLENGDCRFFSDELLQYIIDKNKRDPDNACYEAFILKAYSDGVTLPDGTKMESNRPYWLGLAALYKPNKSRSLKMANEVKLKYNEY